MQECRWNLKKWATSMFCFSFESASGSFLKNWYNSKCTNWRNQPGPGNTEATHHMHLHPLRPSEFCRRLSYAISNLGCGKGDGAASPAAYNEGRRIPCLGTISFPEIHMSVSLMVSQEGLKAKALESHNPKWIRRLYHFKCDVRQSLNFF